MRNPCFFLFDARELLILEDTRFTDGNYSKHIARIGSTSDFLCGLPFNKIYHSGPYNRELNRDIIFHRCAEVFYPHELNLATLRYICCRSEAEKETLLKLLPPEIWSKWQRKIVVSRTRLFECRWTFLEKVRLFHNRILLYFSPDSIAPGPFQITMKIRDSVSGRLVEERRDDFFCDTSPRYEAEIPDAVTEYKVKILLDNCLIHFNEYSLDDLPF